MVVACWIAGRRADNCYREKSVKRVKRGLLDRFQQAVFLLAIALNLV